jgi:hypothetical protein
MTGKVSYAARYHAKWAPYQESWDKLLKEDLDKKNRHLPDNMPGSLVCKNLEFALDCAYAGDHRRAEVFLRRTIEHADWIEEQRRYLDTEVAEAGHPLNLAEIKRGRAYARWLLGEPLDREALLVASTYMTNWCRTKAEDRRRFQISMTMGTYLEGVRAALVGGDLAQAADQLGIDQPFHRHHGVERSLWIRLIDGYPFPKAPFRREFEEFFDRVRDPDFVEGTPPRETFIRRDWLALETGLIRQMYLLNASPEDPMDPRAVLAAVAY